MAVNDHPLFSLFLPSLSLLSLFSSLSSSFFFFLPTFTSFLPSLPRSSLFSPSGYPVYCPKSHAPFSSLLFPALSTHPKKPSHIMSKEEYYEGASQGHVSYHQDNIDNTSEEQEFGAVKRDLKSRHLQMIAIGGTLSCHFALEERQRTKRSHELNRQCLSETLKQNRHHWNWNLFVVWRISGCCGTPGRPYLLYHRR